MSLQKLKEIEDQANSARTKSRVLDGAASDLASIRKGPHSLTGAIDKVFVSWRYGAQLAAKDELYEVINEMASDLYRIAEMRLAAKARFYRVESAQKQAIVTTSILPLPELEEEPVL